MILVHVVGHKGTVAGWQPSISKRGEDWSNPFSFLCCPLAFFAAFHLRMRVIHITVADCSRHRRSTWQPTCAVLPIRIYFVLRSLASLTTAACKTLVHSLVTSRLDYGNAVLYGISDRLLHRLEMVQRRSTAKVVLWIRRGDRRSTTAALEQLHWLPVRYRIEYTILVIVFRALRDRMPTYIASLITPYVPRRALRSADRALLVVPRTTSNAMDAAHSPVQD